MYIFKLIVELKLWVRLSQGVLARGGDILNKQHNTNRIKMMKKKKEKENDLDVLDDLELKEDRFLCFTYSRWLLGYIWVFNVVGIVLFSSFYPWT